MFFGKKQGNETHLWKVPFYTNQNVKNDTTENVLLSNYPKIGSRSRNFWMQENYLLLGNFSHYLGNYSCETEKMKLPSPIFRKFLCDHKENVTYVNVSLSAGSWYLEAKYCLLC